MPRYIARRLIQAIFVVCGVVTMIFFVLRVSGDPAALFVSQDATPADLARMRARLGFDDPLPVQFGRYAVQALRGDFGTSLRFQRPAVELVLDRVSATVELGVAALLFALLLGVPAGVLAAMKRDSVYDNACMTVATLGQCMPTFWLGMLLIVLFGVELRVLPASGRGTFAHLVLPAFTLGYYFMARMARLTRSGMLEALNQEFVRTARAKGLPERAVIYRHALRNALISVVTVTGLLLPGLLGGAIVVEAVFAWPGMGTLLVQSVYSRDYPVVQAVVFFIALAVTGSTLLTDLIYAYLDPRITYG